MEKDPTPTDNDDQNNETGIANCDTNNEPIQGDSLADLVGKNDSGPSNPVTPPLPPRPNQNESYEDRLSRLANNNKSEKQQAIEYLTRDNSTKEEKPTEDNHEKLHNKWWFKPLVGIAVAATAIGAYFGIIKPGTQSESEAPQNTTSETAPSPKHNNSNNNQSAGTSPNTDNTDSDNQQNKDSEHNELTKAEIDKYAKSVGGNISEVADYIQDWMSTEGGYNRCKPELDYNGGKYTQMQNRAMQEKHSEVSDHVTIYRDNSTGKIIVVYAGGDEYEPFKDTNARSIPDADTAEKVIKEKAMNEPRQ